jgi:hypothetical protein
LPPTALEKHDLGHQGGEVVCVGPFRKKSGVYRYNVTEKDLMEVKGVLTKRETLELDALERLLDKRLSGGTPEYEYESIHINF